MKKLLFLTVSVSMLLFIAFPFFSFSIFADDIGDKQHIMNKNNSGLILLDRNNQPFFTFYQAQTDEYIPLSDIPVTLRQAVIAVEDRDFYTNPGYSVRGIIRAMVANIKAGKIIQGGSTISQELVKNELLTSKRSFSRKFQELVLARELNRRFSKEDILEMYLNSAYFGEGAFGVESAAQTYFGIGAKDLNLNQSALLVGLLPAPSAYSPINNPDVAKARQKLVLGQMVSNKYISRDQADNAYNQPIEYNIKDTDLNKLAPHFALYVKEQLIKKYGEEYIIRNGLVVRTSLNSEWQTYAESTVQDQVERLKKNHATNGASVVINPTTGEVLVMVGSKNWHDEKVGKINMAVTPRQSGSAFKPLVYAEALERRLITPATIIKDEPITLSKSYKPSNYDGKFRGPVTVRRALANSLNIPAVEVMQMVGLENSLNAAKRFGITSLSPQTSDYGPALVLGTGEISLLELTNAYSTFANDGRIPDITTILEIKDKYGSKIYVHQKSDRKVVAKDTAYLISSILSDTKARSEVFGKTLNIDRMAAVKTGTSQNYRNALTIGYTPSLVIGVWVGNNDNSAMDKVAGSLGAAPIWKTLMQHYLSGIPEEHFDKPSSIAQITVCHSRKVVKEGIDQPEYINYTDTEFVIEGTQQNQPCKKLPEPSPFQHPPQVVSSDNILMAENQQRIIEINNKIMEKKREISSRFIR